ncbi:MAG: DNA-processing protein DprA [Candidatus Latescibacterota bacterium]
MGVVNVFCSYYPFLALLCIEGVGAVESEKLWEAASKSPREVFEQLRSRTGQKELSLLAGRPLGEIRWDIFTSQIDAADASQTRIICLIDEEYPQYLRDIRTSPPVLFCRGNIQSLRRRGVAIVGTRQPSARGAAFTRAIARDLSACSIMVASGLARGIDTAAHQGALEGSGPVVGVMGTGLDVCYPVENRSLMDAVASRGCIITEQFMGTTPRSYVFPQRNRLISAVSRIVIVVEAGNKSGALITAKWATEQGREVGAVPGFPGDFRSCGVNRLLKMGAAPIEGIKDIFDAVPLLAEGLDAGPCNSGPRRRSDNGTLLAGGEPNDTDNAGLSAVLNALTSSPIDVDALAGHLDRDVREVQSALLELEMKGIVGRDLAGCYYKRK